MYRLRFFFDTGSGICLWSANDAARAQFDYPVELRALPLPETIRRRGYFILAWYDTFMDWEHSLEPSQWWPREEVAFTAAAQEYLSLLRRHLGSSFELIDESKTGDVIGSGEVHEPDHTEEMIELPVRPCAGCGRPIPPERLEVLSETTRCVACQQRTESTQTDSRVSEVICPRCEVNGFRSRMVWRTARDPNIPGYFLGCSRFPECRYVDRS